MVSRALAPVALAAALLLAGCPCDAGHADLFYDDLQRACGELPCGWEALEGDVAHAVTFHSAARGLRLADLGRASRSLPGVLLPSSESGGVLAYLVVACDERTTLLVEVEAEGQPGASEGAVGHITLAASFTPEVGDGSPEVMPRVRLPLVPDGETTFPASHATRLTLAVDGPGACLVDELHLLGGAFATCQ